MSDKYGKAGWDHKREQVERIDAREMAESMIPPSPPPAETAHFVEQDIYDSEIARISANFDAAFMARANDRNKIMTDDLKDYARTLELSLSTRAIVATGSLECQFNNQKAEAYLVEQLTLAGFRVTVQAGTEPEIPSLAERMGVDRTGGGRHGGI